MPKLQREIEAAWRRDREGNVRENGEKMWGNNGGGFEGRAALGSEGECARSWPRSSPGGSGGG
jgi:hypothetical protein